MQVRDNIHRLILLFLVLAASVAIAGQEFVYIPLDYPNSIGTCTRGMNDSGEIVGGYVDSSGNLHGFIRDKYGKYSAIDYPDESVTGTLATGINNRHEIVGIYLYGDRRGAFRRGADGTFSAIDVTGFDPSAEPFVAGINRQGTVVGFLTVGGRNTGLRLGADELVTEVAYPSAVETELGGITDDGLTSGSYFDGVQLRGLLMQSGGSATSHEYPGAFHTWLLGLNRDSVAVGAYSTAAARELLNETHGLRLNKDGSFDVIEPPAAAASFASAVNRNGYIVGCWVDSTGTTHGFLARPPLKQLPRSESR